MLTLDFTPVVFWISSGLKSTYQIHSNSLYGTVGVQLDCLGSRTMGYHPSFNSFHIILYNPF